MARTVTSTVRVLDAVAEFRGDPRVRVLFTVNDSSPFRSGVRELLAEQGVRVVPWDRVGRCDVDAAVTASENTELAAIDAPVLVLPHGVGFHKLLPNTRGRGQRLSGSVRDEDLVGRHVQIAVSHPGQAAQLALYSPQSRGRTVVVQDPVYERLRASAVLRERYRAALGVGDRRLVVVSSTWGPQSLLGRWPDLPARLLAGLDVDRHVVASVLHPNVIAGHGAWEVRSWLAAARAAGLVMVPSEAGWPAAVLAADCLVGDHGSVSLYGASVDVPLLLAPFGDEVVAGTPMARLGRLADTLDPRRPLADQVDAAIGRHEAGRYGGVVAEAFAPSPPARSLRSVLYEMVGLSEPVDGVALNGWPAPVPERAVATAWVMLACVTDEGVTLRRFPAAVNRYVDVPPSGWIRQLCVSDEEWDLRLLHSASTVLREAEDRADEAARWVEDALVRFPGCLVAAAATRGATLVAVRDRDRYVVRGPAGVSASAVSAAWVYARLRAGIDPAGEGIVRLGPVNVRIAATRR